MSFHGMEPPGPPSDFLIKAIIISLAWPLAAILHLAGVEDPSEIPALVLLVGLIAETAWILLLLKSLSGDLAW